MPSDAVTIAVSAGIGISVIAGVLSGMCYILVQGLRRKRIQEQSPEWHCSVCRVYLRPRFFDDPKAVLCIQCEERICRSRCSKRLRRGWICYKCLKKTSWLKNTYDDVVRSKHKKMLQIQNDKTMKINTDIFRTNEKDHIIRDFIENLVAVILGENVDDASVFRIQVHKQYNKLFEKYYHDLCIAITNLSAALQVSTNDVPFVVQTPSTAHSNLKEILENILKDASHMPADNDGLEYSNSDHTEQTYEQLLAAAILNKVIGKYQNNFLTMSEKSTKPKTDNIKDLHGKEELENCEWNSDDLDSTGSSLDENLASDACYTTKYVDRVSLTIQKQIEELYPKIVENQIKDNPEDTRYFLDDSSNWYLQKRLFRAANSPIPVPMVVPNPLSTSKVLIGEKEADDTSDLSDDESIIKPIVDSADEEMSADSGIKDERNDKRKFSTYQKIVDDENVEDESLVSLYENTDNELESSRECPRLPRNIFKNVSTIQKFGRDYYTKQASLPSGKKKSYEDENQWSSRDSLFDEDPITLGETSNVETRNYQFDSIPSETDENEMKFDENSNSDEINIYEVNPESDNLNIIKQQETTEEPKEKVFWKTSQERKITDFWKPIPKKAINEDIISPVDTIDTINKSSFSLNEVQQPVIRSKKCDNTLIKKIYSDPVVRSFALVNREHIPVEFNDKTHTPKEDTKPTPEQQKSIEFESSPNTTDLEDEVDNHPTPNFNNSITSNTFSLEFSDNEAYQTPSVYKNDDYNELKGKKLVANRLNDFSKSFPNLVKTKWSMRHNFNKNKSTENIEKSNDTIEIPDEDYISVKNLKKLFENNMKSNKKDQPVHSLTARSIPKKMKENLKNFGSD